MSTALAKKYLDRYKPDQYQRTNARAALMGYEGLSEAEADRELDGTTGSTVTAPAVEVPKTVVLQAAPAVREPSVLEKAALRCVEKGWYVFALGEKTKTPDGELSPNGFNSSTNDANVVREIWTKKPNANIGIDLGRSGLTVLDFDNGLPPAELGLQNTFQVRTARGTHVYFAETSKQGKMYFNGEPVGDIKSVGGYVLAQFSVHPNGPVYTVTVPSAIGPVPAGLLEKLAAPRKTSPTVVGEKIPYGQHDTELTRIAGKLRGAGMEEDSIYDALVEVCEKRCEGYGADYKTMCRKIARSIGRRPLTLNTDIALTQGAAASTATLEFTSDEPEIEESQIATRPVFPSFVMTGTSLFDGLAKPASETSSKYPELIWLPAVQLLLNSVAIHVRLKNIPSDIPNMFVGVVAPYGKFYKSTCCELGHKYFETMGLLGKQTRDMKNSDGKIVITSVGSTEGLGKELSRINAKKALLYFDELGKFAGKAGIENSSLGEDLLTMYESGFFSNLTKESKSSFCFESGTYCFGWQWCTTDRAFPKHWAKLDNISTGLNDRMFFLLAPEDPRESEMFTDPDFSPGIVKTFQRIQEAIQRGTFEYEDFDSAKRWFKGLDARGLRAAERLALYFAIDLGLPGIIDDDCCERARALADYRRDVLAYLDPVEGETVQGKKQMEITRELRRNGGKMRFRELRHNLNGERWGSGLWASCFDGLTKDGTIAYRPAKAGKGSEQRPAMVYLLKQERWEQVDGQWVQH